MTTTTFSTRKPGWLLIVWCLVLVVGCQRQDNAEGYIVIDLGGDLHVLEPGVDNDLCALWVDFRPDYPEEYSDFEVRVTCQEWLQFNLPAPDLDESRPSFSRVEVGVPYPVHVALIIDRNEFPSSRFGLSADEFQEECNLQDYDPRNPSPTGVLTRLDATQWTNSAESAWGEDRFHTIVDLQFEDGCIKGHLLLYLNVDIEGAR